MTTDEYKALSFGDLVRHARAGSEVHFVTGNYGDHVAAARLVDITNPVEWVLVSKSRHEEKEV